MVDHRRPAVPAIPVDLAAAEPPTPEQAAAELRATLGPLYRQLRQSHDSGNLSLPESSALSRLERGGPMPAADLAKIERVSPQSIAVTLQRLEARGLVQRAPDPTDGRRVILSPTGSGRDVVHARRARRQERLARALAELSGAERAQLMTALPLLQRIADAI
jgi:DNA-binding MarR family transcriptional regulator